MGVRRSDREIALKLIETGSVRRTAKELEVSESSLYARKQKPAFRKVYNELMDDLMEGVTGRLQAGALTAVNTLLDIINNPKVNEQTRANASASLLSNLLKFRECVDIVQRIERLEEIQNENG